MNGAWFAMLLAVSLTQQVTDLSQNPLSNELRFSFGGQRLPPLDCEVRSTRADEWNQYGVTNSKSGDVLLLSAYYGATRGVEGRRYSFETDQWGPPKRIPGSDFDRNPEQFNLAWSPSGVAMALFTRWKWHSNGGYTHDRLYSAYYDSFTGEWDEGVQRVEDDVIGGCAGSVRGAKLAADGLGNFMAVWSHEVCSQSYEYSIFARLWDGALGQWDRRSLTVLETEWGEARSPLVAGDPHGNFWVIWGQKPEIYGGHGKYSLYGRYYDAGDSSWEPREPLLLEYDDSDSAYPGALVSDNNGNFTALWTQTVDPVNGGDGKVSLYTRRYDAASGEWDPAGPVLLEDKLGNVSTTLHLASCPKGNLMALWMQAPPGTNRWSLFARRFDASTGEWDPSGRVLLEDRTQPCYYPSISSLEPDTFWVTWFQHSAGADPDIWRKKYTSRDGWGTNKGLYPREFGNKMRGLALPYGRGMVIGDANEFLVCD